MGGFDNYGADDLYNMEDVWNDKGYDQKMPKKVSMDIFRNISDSVSIILKSTFLTKHKFWSSNYTQ